MGVATDVDADFDVSASGNIQFNAGFTTNSNSFTAESTGGSVTFLDTVNAGVTSITSNADINTATLNVGDLKLVAGNDVVINELNGGNIAASVTGDLNVTSAANLNISSVNGTAGVTSDNLTITLNNNSNLTDSNSITTSGTTSISNPGNGDITLDVLASDYGTLTIQSAANFDIETSNALILDGINDQIVAAVNVMAFEASDFSITGAIGSNGDDQL